MKPQDLNFFERAIFAISPQLALKRELARFSLRSFDAASQGRRTSSWTSSGKSANTEVYGAQRILRERSRELSRNNPYVKRAIQSITNNVVGTGVRAKLTSKNVRQKDKVHSEWKAWFDSTECDHDGRKTGYGIQKMVIRAVASDGDCLIIRKRDKSARIPIKLQVLEIDYLDVNKNSYQVTTDGSFDFMGIRFNSKGRRIGYWLYDKHPGDLMNVGSAVSTLISADSVIHVYEQLRAGQQMGVPFGVSGFMRARDMDEYNDAQVVKQKLAACSVMVVTTPSDLPDEDVEEFERMEPGAIMKMKPGEEVTFGSPPSVENIAEFSRIMMQGVAAGFGTTYENLTGDLNNVNFSSGRMGWIEHHRNIEDWQWELLIPQFCQPMWKWFADAAELVGISVGSVTAEWTPPRREMIDPSKEIKGIVAGMRAGLISPTDAIREQGFDPEDVLMEIVEWNKKLDENKVILDSDPRQGKAEGTGAGRPTETGANSNDNVDKK